MSNEIERVLRGDSWIVRSTYRFWANPGFLDGDLGFRPVFRLKKIKR